MHLNRSIKISKTIIFLDNSLSMNLDFSFRMCQSIGIPTMASNSLILAQPSFLMPMINQAIINIISSDYQIGPHSIP